MNLHEILVCFNSPIKEEQAWAVCYLCCKFLKSKEAEQRSLPSGPKFIEFDKDGNVTISATSTSSHDEIEIVDNLGRSIFAALDYGLLPDEQQVISPELECLISSMTGTATQSDDDAPDEGFSDNKAQEFTIDDVISLCESHLSSTETSSHYLAVCRALVHEALELKVFLSKIASANACLQKLSGDNSNLQDKGTDDVASLNFKEWAHVWMQVLDELRQGVTKLRKVERQSKMSIEYELTPYEILMEDIRQQKYTLKKVTSEQKISAEVKKNAHDIILDFIKSRPSLSPAHERILNPTPPRSKSLHEKLLEQIQGKSVALKHVEMTSSRSFTIIPMSCQANGTVTQRRRIKPSFVIDDVDSLKSDSDVEDIELFVSDYDVIGDASSSTFLKDEIANASLRSSGTSGVSSSSAGDFVDNGQRPKALELSQTMQRKRVLPLELLPSPAESPVSVSPQKRFSFFGSLFSSFRNPSRIRRTQSVFTQISDFKTEWDQNHAELENHIPERIQENLDLKSIPISSTPFRRTFSERRVTTPVGRSGACVSLTLDEVMHIRQVLTRAKLEKFQSSPAIYQALKNEKICFHCRLKKFYIFSRPYTCQICKRKVCGKCLKKALGDKQRCREAFLVTEARFPFDKFIETPVYSLEPALTPIMLRKKTIFTHSSTVTSHCEPSDNMTSSESPRVNKMDACLECFEMTNAGKMGDN